MAKWILCNSDKVSILHPTAGRVKNDEPTFGVAGEGDNFRIADHPEVGSFNHYKRVYEDSTHLLSLANSR